MNEVVCTCDIENSRRKYHTESCAVRQSKKRIERTVICKGCQVEFKTKRPNQLYCKTTCYYEHGSWYIAYYPGLPTGTVGAIAELRVAVDLMAKGYEVFRALSPHCSCDLAILRHGKLLRIEVRTANQNPNTGHIHKSKAPKDHGRQDHYAFCLGDKIIYDPELPKAEKPKCD